MTCFVSYVDRQGTSSYHHHRSGGGGGGGGVKDPLLRKQRYDETPDDGKLKMGRRKAFYSNISYGVRRSERKKPLLGCNSAGMA